MRAAQEKHAAEERRLERERQEEVRHRQLRQEVSPAPELPQSKGKEPELALQSEGGQESRRCDSCVKQNAECIRIKVSA